MRLAELDLRITAFKLQHMLKMLRHFRRLTFNILLIVRLTAETSAVVWGPQDVQNIQISKNSDIFNFFISASTNVILEGNSYFILEGTSEDDVHFN